MRYIENPDSLESELVIGTIKQINLDVRKSNLLIEDEDGDLHKVDVHSELLKPVGTDITGSKVICGTRCGYTSDSPYPFFVDVFEILHFLDGSKAGETLQYYWKSG